MPLVAVKTKSRRKYDLAKRDLYGLSAMDRIKMRLHCKNIVELIKLGNLLRAHSAVKRAIFGVAITELGNLLRIILVDIPDRPIRIYYDPMTFESFDWKLRGMGITWSERFCQRFAFFYGFGENWLQPYQDVIAQDQLESRHLMPTD